MLMKWFRSIQVRPARRGAAGISGSDGARTQTPRAALRRAVSSVDLIESLEQRRLMSLVINTSFNSSVTSLSNAAQVENAFNFAAQQYESLFSNSITINITLIASPGTSHFGNSSYPLQTGYTFSQIKAALAANVTSSADATAVASLPASDPTGGGEFWVSFAEAKALGLRAANDPASDGSVTFGAGQSWTFDPNNRAVSGEFDFIGMAEHEIAEVLGRNFGLGTPEFVPYDLFRYTAAGAPSLSRNNSNAYFSIDGGVTNLDNFQNSPTGNGLDPQDWAGTSPYTPDAYNAREQSGVQNGITPTDVTAMEVLGYGNGNAQSAPVVTTQPKSQSVVAGQTVTFTANASGSPTPGVQWQISSDGGNTFNNIAGATSTTYTFSAGSGQNGDLFRAVFSNSIQSGVASNAATLTVGSSLTAPVVTTEPNTQNVLAGSSVTFTAAASGNPAPTVHWQISNDGGSSFSNISGATSTTYTFTATTGQDGDQFRAVFSNSVQSGVASNSATLSITPLSSGPVVNLQPASQSIAAGGSVSFSASAGGNPAPTVKWQISTNGGSTFSNISGATSTTYTFATALTQNGDLFRAVFSNSVQSGVASNAATLTVIAALAHPVITTQPKNQSVTAGNKATFTAAASGNPAPAVQWQVSTNGGASFSSIAGATSTTYSFTASAGQTGNLFRASFSNSVQSGVTTIAATLTVASGPSSPVVISQPQNQNVAAGSSATFTAAASGNPAPTVQWQISTDGGSTFTDISGQNSTTYSFVASSGDNSSEYRAVFSNVHGSADTAAAHLTVATAGSQSAIVPTLGAFVLPTQAVAGAKMHLKLPVVITNHGIPFNGNVTIDICAETHTSLDGSQTLVTSLTKKLSLKAGKSHTFAFSIKSLPPSLISGSYHLLAEVFDAAGSAGVAASTATVNVAPAFVRPAVTISAVTPSSLTAGQSGTVIVTVANDGNVTANGVVITLAPSQDGLTPLSGMTLATFKSNAKIAPNTSKTFKLHFKLTSTMPAGSYFPFATVSLGGVTTTAAGSTQFTVA
jgi:hypothetical protein